MPALGVASYRFVCFKSACSSSIASVTSCRPWRASRPSRGLCCRRRIHRCN